LGGIFSGAIIRENGLKFRRGIDGHKVLCQEALFLGLAGQLVGTGRVGVTVRTGDSHGLGHAIAPLAHGKAIGKFSDSRKFWQDVVKVL